MTTSNTLAVNTPGLYWVKVTNEFNCTATDSVTIASVLPAPNNFLQKTDSICNYGNTTIISEGSFSKYLWSTGSIGRQINIENPGTYWLSVTDTYGCTGTDTISVYLKNCMLGVYLPTAFTPNNDGHNDQFRALVFGKVQSFMLQVFNREGQLVFQTTDPAIGWNGVYKGTSYSTATFVWQCSYQLEGRKPEHQKGTVTIIR